MKKTFPVNINGSVFYIDEDAYNLLNTYLEQLRRAFPGKEGAEIVPDIEARIAEHFADVIAAGARVINIDDVNQVIERMGRPSDLSDDEGGGDGPDSPDGPDKPKDPADAGSASQGGSGVAYGDGAVPPPFGPGASQQPQGPVHKRLYRDERNKVFGGVLSGVACYLGWNVNILRVFVIILACFTKILPLSIVYLLAWMIIPPARTPRQILEMMGTPVTVGSVGNTILGSQAPGGQQSGNFFSGMWEVLGKILMIFICLVAGCIGLGFIAALIAAICGLIVYAGWGSLTILDGFDMFEVTAHPVLGGFGVILLAITVLIPCVALVWAGCCVVFKARGASNKVMITTAVVEVILIITTVCMLTVANFEPIHGSIALAAGATSGITFFSLT